MRKETFWRRATWKTPLPVRLFAQCVVAGVGMLWAGLGIASDYVIHLRAVLQPCCGSAEESACKWKLCA